MSRQRGSAMKRKSRFFFLCQKIDLFLNSTKLFKQQNLFSLVIICVIFNFATVCCSTLKYKEVNSLSFKNVLTSESVQSSAFHQYDNELYVAYVTRGTTNSTLWVYNISRETSWFLDLNINGVWDLKGHNNSFALGGEDGNLHIININTREIEVVKNPFLNEKPIVSIASGGNVIYCGTYKQALIFGYNTSTRKYVLENKVPYFAGESYIRSLAYSKKNHTFVCRHWN